jgi:hypothetical protein
MADDEDTAVKLLEEALHLLTHGEYAPGGSENWPGWIAKTEAFLRRRLAGAEAWGARGPSASYGEWVAEGREDGSGG